MTNHAKFTESHDSAARSVGYEGAKEIRPRDEANALIRELWKLCPVCRGTGISATPYSWGTACGSSLCARVRSFLETK